MFETTFSPSTRSPTRPINNSANTPALAENVIRGGQHRPREGPSPTGKINLAPDRRPGHASHPACRQPGLSHDRAWHSPSGKVGHGVHTPRSNASTILGEAQAEIAADENWEPRSVATVLSRNATWTNGRQTLDLFLAAFRNTSDAHAQTWAHAAVFGLHGTADIDNFDDRLKAVTVVTLAAEAARPERAAIFIAALEGAEAEHAEGVVRSALESLRSTIKSTLPTEEAVTAFLQILSRLSDNYRLYGTHLILKIKRVDPPTKAYRIQHRNPVTQGEPLRDSLPSSACHRSMPRKSDQAVSRRKRPGQHV